MNTLLHLVLMFCFAISALAEDERSDELELEIVSASYGFEHERIVVSNLLRPLRAHGVLLLRAPWGFSNPDPKPGATKDVVIVYRHRGTEGTATFSQDQDILLPPASTDLTIISASYGVPNSRIDVTGAVRATVKAGAIKLAAGWSLSRVDPAAFKVKSVEITYVHNEILQTASFNQDQELVLPSLPPNDAPNQTAERTVAPVTVATPFQPPSPPGQLHLNTQ